MTLLLMSCIRAALLVFLLRRLSGLPAWQKGVMFSILCILLRFNFFDDRLAAQREIWSFVLLLGGLAAYSLILSVAYFSGVEKVPGRLNLPFQILGGLLLVLVL